MRTPGFECLRLALRHAKLRLPLLLLALFVFVATPALAQSPNTASMIVNVVDQAGAVIPDAKVSVVNAATGAAREAASGSDGSATFSALSLTGTYTVTVSREGDDLSRSPNFWLFNKFRATRFLTEIYVRLAVTLNSL